MDIDHVDRRDLYTNLEERVKFMHKFLEFNETDVKALISAQKLVKEFIPVVTDKIYEKLLGQDITARVFHTHDSRVEEDPEEFLKPHDQHTAMRKMFVRWYLLKLNSDPTSMEYWEYLDKVGRLHVGKEKNKPVFVEYALLGTTLGYIQGLFNEAILTYPGIDLETKTVVVLALGKLLWMQNDLLARYHVQEQKEFATPKPAEQPLPPLPTFSAASQGCATESRKREDAGHRPLRCPFTGRLY